MPSETFIQNNYEKRNENILRSESVSELISINPGFMIRYGITLFFIILVMICCISWFIQYPDVINASAKLTSMNAPKTVIAKTDGKLMQLNIQENDSVISGAVIGYIESIAKPEQVLQLSGELDSISNCLIQNKSEKIISFFSPGAISARDNLGELQSPYQVFAQSFATFSNYLSNGFYLRKKQMLFVDMENIQKLQQNILEQKQLQEQDLSLSQKNFAANDTLKKQKVISDLEYRAEKSKLLNKEMSIPQLNTSLIGNETQLNEKQKEIIELNNTILQQKQIFREALNTFMSQVEEWKKKYLLVAPIDGHISFSNFIQKNQEVQAGQVICFINPGNSDYYAEMLITQNNFGKVKTGQDVLLKFPAYPSTEFGSIKGKIDFISSIPTDSGYLARVSLPEGLKTNYGKQLQYRDGLIAEGQVITKNMRLLQRFYYNLYGQLRR